MSKRVTVRQKEDALVKLRDFLGFGDVRKSITEFYLKGHNANIYIHNETFNNKDMFIDFLDDLHEINADIIMFYAENYSTIEADEVNEIGETHYQSFIFVPSKNTIYCVDPSRRPDGEGMYDPRAVYFAHYVIGHKHKFKWVVIYPDSPQVTKDDVFCQTWSLYVAIHFVKNALRHRIFDTHVYVPKSLKEKAKLLLDFYKEILKNVIITNNEGRKIPFKIEFSHQYKDKTHKMYNIIMAMKPSDIFTGYEIIEEDYKSKWTEKKEKFDPENEYYLDILNYIN